MTPPALSVPVVVVEDTLAFLRLAGTRNSEGVVLWLGRQKESAIVVGEAYAPVQEVFRDSFRIPPSGMSALLAHLGDTGTLVAAQVHSHPHRAFHSRADDTWAIVRHFGALSIVVPHFARNISVRSFTVQMAAYRLSATNRWHRLNPSEGAEALIIV